MLFYLTERCNSRCVTCDYWRHGRADMTLAALQTLLPSLRRLRTQVALLSGGEPLLNPDWPAMAATLREAGIKPWLLTSGLSLQKHARHAAALFETITVSLDGADPKTYQATQRFECVRAMFAKGIRASRRARRRPQSESHGSTRQFLSSLPGSSRLAKELGARQVSFLAVDVANPHAFGRMDDFAQDLALSVADLATFE